MIDSKSKSMLKLLLQMPAVGPAIVVISMLGIGLDLGPLIQRVLFGIYNISKTLWREVGSIIGYDLNEAHGLLTFSAVSLGMIFWSFWAERPQVRKYSVRSLLMESISAAFLFSIVMFKSPYVFDNPISFLFFMNIFFIYLFYYLSIKSIISNNSEKNAINIVVRVACFFIALIIIELILSLNIMVISGTFSLLIIWLIVYFSPPNRYLYSSVSVFSMIIYSISFFNKSILPSIDSWLGSIGA